MAGPLPFGEDLRGNAWKCSVDRRRQSWTITRHDPRNHFNLKFSDFAFLRASGGREILNPSLTASRSLLLSKSFSPWTLWTILALQTSHMRGFINEGLIAVLFTGPPCETWSSLRAGEALQVTLAVTVGPICMSRIADG